MNARTSPHPEVIPRYSTDPFLCPSRTYHIYSHKDSKNITLKGRKLSDGGGLISPRHIINWQSSFRWFQGREHLRRARPELPGQAEEEKDIINWGLGIAYIAIMIISLPIVVFVGQNYADSPIISLVAIVLICLLTYYLFSPSRKPGEMEIPRIVRLYIEFTSGVKK